MGLSDGTEIPQSPSEVPLFLLRWPQACWAHFSTLTGVAWGCDARLEPGRGARCVQLHRSPLGRGCARRQVGPTWVALGRWVVFNLSSRAPFFPAGRGVPAAGVGVPLRGGCTRGSPRGRVKVAPRLSPLSSPAPACPPWRHR